MKQFLLALAVTVTTSMSLACPGGHLISFTKGGKTWMQIDKAAEKIVLADGVEVRTLILSVGGQKISLCSNNGCFSRHSFDLPAATLADYRTLTSVTAELYVNGTLQTATFNSEPMSMGAIARGGCGETVEAKQ